MRRAGYYIAEQTPVTRATIVTQQVGKVGASAPSGSSAKAPLRRDFPQHERPRGHRVPDAHRLIIRPANRLPAQRPASACTNGRFDSLPCAIRSRASAQESEYGRAASTDANAP